MKKWKIKVVNPKSPCIYCKRFMEFRGAKCKCLKYRMWFALVEREVCR